MLPNITSLIVAKALTARFWQTGRSWAFSSQLTRPKKSWAPSSTVKFFKSGISLGLESHGDRAGTSPKKWAPGQEERKVHYHIVMKMASPLAHAKICVDLGALGCKGFFTFPREDEGWLRSNLVTAVLYRLVSSCRSLSPVLSLCRHPIVRLRSRRLPRPQHPVACLATERRGLGLRAV